MDVETDMLHLNVMGSRLVFLSDSDVAAELVERSSAIYADRVCKRSDTFTIFALTGAHRQPRLPMASELYELSNSSNVRPTNNPF